MMMSHWDIHPPLSFYKSYYKYLLDIIAKAHKVMCLVIEEAILEEIVAIIQNISGIRLVLIIYNIIVRTIATAIIESPIYSGVV